MSRLAWLDGELSFVIYVLFCDGEPQVIFGVLYHLYHLNVEIICLSNLQGEIRASSSCGCGHLVSLDHLIVIDVHSNQQTVSDSFVVL
jgi:hypothetical protein